MGIEESFASIAATLERIAATLEAEHANSTERLALLQWQKDRMEKSPTSSSIAPKAEAPAATAPAQTESAASSAPAAPEAAPAVDYDILKAELIKRGIEIPKGTKMTTLQKLWAAHKDDPVKPAEETAPATLVEAPVEETAPAAPVEEAEKKDELDDIFSKPEPEQKEEEKPLTTKEAREIITKEYDSSEHDKSCLMKALASVGAERFTDVKEEDYRKLIAEYRRIRGAK